jgi:ABC-2 type transport system ATP-binding protein
MGGFEMIADVSTIVARGMGIRRGRRWILRPAAFGIAGGVVGLAGPPGVGKTTLLTTFATLRRPQAGALEILGYDTRDPAELRSVRARLGYLPDDFGWAASLRVSDFVAYTAYYKRAPAEAVEAALVRMDLRDVATMELGMLPADVRLRAGLAATCVNEPDIVLLDEPLADIDDEAVDLWPLIRSLAPTVLVTAQAAERLSGRCDRIFTLARGRLTARPTEPAEPAPSCRAGPRPATATTTTAVHPRRAYATAAPRPARIGAGV